MNRLAISGRITNNLELRKSENNISIVNFEIACKRKFAKENEKDADFIPVTVFNHSADYLYRYAKKGTLVEAEAHIQENTYKNKENKTVKKLNVVLDNVSILSNGKTSDDVESEFTNNVLDIPNDDLPF